MHFTLRQLGLIDAPPEAVYNNLTSLAAEWLRVPIAHVSILDRETMRIFYKSQHGHATALASDRQLPMELTYCQHVALTQAPVVVADARVHPLLKSTHAQAGELPLAYLGLPVYGPDGKVVGGLCMMQAEKRHWTKEEIDKAKKLAGCVSDLIRLKAATLMSEKLLREQQVLTDAITYDLKSPAISFRLILDEFALEGDCLSGDVQLLITEGRRTVEHMEKQAEELLARFASH